MSTHVPLATAAYVLSTVRHVLKIGTHVRLDWRYAVDAPTDAAYLKFTNGPTVRWTRADSAGPIAAFYRSIEAQLGTWRP